MELSAIKVHIRSDSVVRFMEPELREEMKNGSSHSVKCSADYTNQG